MVQSVSSKVGVGEVFIIGGQSNAQGLPNSTGDINIAQSSLDYDGVRTQPVNVGLNANLPRTFYETVSASSLDQIKAEYVQNTLRAAQTPTNQGIAPAGNSLWYWSYLGQRIAQQYDVPVAFYNVAWGGTHIKAWAQSTDNASTPAGDPRGGPSNLYGSGAPYRILRAALRLYGGIYGVRSVLWLQGETDAKAVNEIQSWGARAVSSSDDYKNNLQQVIAQTRTDFGPVPWVVGQTSIIGGDPANGMPNVVKDSPISLLVANGQSLAATTASGNAALQVSIAGSSVGSQVFSGPNMNNSVTVRRSPGSGDPDEPVHFRRIDFDGKDGLKEAGDAWFDVLNTMLSSQASDRIRPVAQARLGTEFQTLSINEPANTISAPSGYNVMWVADNNGTFDLSSPVGYGQTISSNGSGRLRAILTNSQGNRILTQAINLPYTLVDDTSDPGGTPPSGSSQCKNGNENSGGNRTPNGTIVGGFGNSSEFMEYIFNVQTGGSTNFSIHYASGDSQAGMMLVVNGTSVPLYRPGTASWTPNADASTTINLNAGNNTIRIQGSRDGNFAYDRLCIGSGGTPPPGCFSIAPTVSNPNPGCNAPLTLNANCSGADCSGVTYAWSGNGQSYSGATPGITGPGSNGTTTYSVTASKAGCSNQTGSVNVTVSGCGGGTTEFSIAGVQLNCGTGVVTLSLNGANGSAIEYRAVGLQDWSTALLTMPAHQRNNTSFTFYARQSGVEANTAYTTSCGGYRVATQREPTGGGIVG
ncbi:MAG: hypothetical protein LH609_07085 [Rudanella sp.]|nr:hypothetical protein [Rudanella sp.]